jgi:hypothetical protein
MHQRRAERRRPGGDGGQVDHADGGGAQGADQAEGDQPVGPGGEGPSVGAVGDVGRHIEAQAGHPRSERDGHEDRVDRVAVGSGQRGDRVLGPEHPLPYICNYHRC